MDNDLSEEMIQQEMQATRAALSEKLETLEQKVVGTVENATTTVNQTVDAIKETVQETVTTVRGGVKDSVDTLKDLLDVSAQVQRHPWLVVGGSVAVGFYLGNIPTPNTPPSASPVPQSLAPSSRPAPRATEPSLWSPELAKLKGLALGVLFGVAREMLASSMPEHLGAQFGDVVDSVTRKMGGEPLPASDLSTLCETAAAGEERQAEPASQTSRESQPDMGNGHSAARRW